MEIEMYQDYISERNNEQPPPMKRIKPSTNPGMHRRARRPFDYKSAGGGVYVAEEQMKFASAINFWP